MSSPNPPPEWLKQWATVVAKLAALGVLLIQLFRVLTA